MARPASVAGRARSRVRWSADRRLLRRRRRRFGRRGGAEDFIDGRDLRGVDGELGAEAVAARRDRLRAQPVAIGDVAEGPVDRRHPRGDRPEQGPVAREAQRTRAGLGAEISRQPRVAPDEPGESATAAPVGFEAAAARLRPKYGLDMPLAGKTGTTQANADAWFMCYSPDLVVGAWVGFEQPSVHFISNSSGAGATAALPIVGEFLKKAYADRTEKLSRDDFAMPSDSSFTINFDCSPLPVPVDTGKKTNVVGQWFADIKAKHQDVVARKDSIAKATGKKEKHPLLKKLKHKPTVDATQ